MAISRERLEERLGCRVAHFAYPFGGAAHASSRDFRLARELGFDTATTTRHGNVMTVHRHTPHALPRLSLNGKFQSMAALDVFLSGAARAMTNPLGNRG